MDGYIFVRKEKRDTSAVVSLQVRDKTPLSGKEDESEEKEKINSHK